MQIQAVDLKEGRFFQDENEVFQVVKYTHIKKARAAAVIRVKIRNIQTGSVLEKTFASDQKFAIPDLEKRSGSFLYSDDNKLIFMDEVTYDQFEFDSEKLGFEPLLLIGGQKVIVSYLDSSPIGVELPKVVIMKVVSAPDVDSGGTVTNPSKRITLESGLEMLAPMFIKVGEEIRINTEDISYSGRNNE